MAETTLAELIAETARRFGTYKAGAASEAGTTTALVDENNLYEPDDFWVGNYLHMSAAGEERPVTDYSQADHELTVSPALSAAVSSADEYELLATRRENLKEAINASIRAAGVSWPVLEMDTATINSISASDYDYALPADLFHLLGVFTRPAATMAWVPLPRDAWQVAGTMGAQMLQISPTFALPDGASTRLDYLARPSFLSADTDTLGIGEPGERECIEFVIAHALFWLHDRAASADPTGGAYRSHLTQAQSYKEIAERIRAQSAQWPPARSDEEE